MFVYVWNGERTGGDILSDWTNGMIVAIANTAEEARETARKKMLEDGRPDYANGFFPEPDYVYPIDKPAAWYQPGGA